MSEIENLKIYGGATYTVGNENIIANEWEAGVTYVKGKSYVIREHKLYVCNVTHTSVEPFDVTKWTEITIGDAIGNNIGDLSNLTTTDKSSIVGAVNEVDEFISHLSNKYVIGGTKAASGITRVDFGVAFSSPPVVSVIPLNATSPQTYLRTCALVTLTSTYFEFVEIAIQNGSSTLVNGTDNCVWIAAGNKA